MENNDKLNLLKVTKEKPIKNKTMRVSELIFKATVTAVLLQTLALLRGGVSYVVCFNIEHRHVAKYCPKFVNKI